MTRLNPILAVAVLLGSTVSALAGIGTAQPPLPGRGEVPALAAPAPQLFPPQSADWDDVKPFTVVGYLQRATVTGENCPTVTAPSQHGGTAIVNDVVIVIPCNTILQMPAAAYPWAKLFESSFKAKLTLPQDGTGQASGGSGNTSSGQPAFAFPSTEVTIHGNIVAGRYIAGLVFISQQSLNTGSGYITGFDYEKGVILVGPTVGNPQVRLQLNDGAGRFSKGQSPDVRFNADDENATMRASTGYPMCVPRKAPPANGSSGEDQRCPQRNRPLAVNGCRNFAAARTPLPLNRDLTPPAAGQTYCSSFVMGPYHTAGTSLPLATEQAPFQIGDFVTYQGTLLKGSGQGPGNTDTISAHTIIANVGIYTEPGTLPSYLAIEAVSISGDTPRRAFNGVPQEPTSRLVLEAMTTDVLSVVDAYFVDLDPLTGDEQQRWITPGSMTGGRGTFGSNEDVIDGGITTQFTGPVPGRVRLQAGKAGPGILYSPTRNIRVVSRTLCDPANINTKVAKFDEPTTLVPCLLRAEVANKLHAGQFAAPVFEFIFPEAIVPGDPAVPNNFWSFGFLINGEGPNVGPLIPSPW